ncbi:MAG TPA: CotH kinase family protein [Verrucomicrobiae bacterium]|nr:CotH kinase family protein [Verrucomicrobiae bacterium]
MSGSTLVTDQECLAAWRRHPQAEVLGPLIERYTAFVYSSAYRRTGRAEDADAVTRAVFLVLARRARKLPKRTALAGWLFHVTAITCRKRAGKPRRTSRWRWLRRRPKNEPPADVSWWTLAEPHIDAALERLPSSLREAVLVRTFLNTEPAFAARLLRTSERRLEKRLGKGLKKLARRLRRSGVDPQGLAVDGAREGCAAPAAAPTLLAEILSEIQATLTRRPACPLARRTLNTLAWARWRRRFLVVTPSLFLLLGTMAGAAWYIDSLTGHSRLISMFLIWSAKNEGKNVPGLMQPAKTWPTDPAAVRLSAAGVRRAADLYQGTNIWLAHLSFTPDRWKALEPRRIPPLPHFFQPDGTVLLRHPDAQRSGLAGVLGFEFNWVTADLELGGVSLSNVATRIKGNGSYLSSLYGDKRAFKVDLNKFVKGQKLGGVDKLTFNNLVNDQSCLNDALAYEFFRDAGVPASRTAYAYLSVSVNGDPKWNHKPLGLYGMVEAVDEDFALERFGSKRTPLFKPVTYELFEHLGDDWQAYAAIYDLKTEATSAQKRRVIAFAHLVTFASDAEFAEQLADFLDLDQFARFLACQVLLSNYDSFLSDGQNFYLYLDVRSDKFGFIPWDLDASWGSFALLGSTKDRERASIWHPWVGQNRFLERVLAVEPFRQKYRAQLEDLLARLFVPSRLRQRIDDVAKAIREPLAAESDFRLAKFEDSISNKPTPPSTAGKSHWADRPAHRLKRFVEQRATSVRNQLDGKSNGVILKRPPRGGN